jgi:hypothetical protein
MQKNKRWRHPLDPKTGRVMFTPVLRSSGERLELEVEYASFPRSSKWYAVYGKECDIPGCNCDAWVEEIPAPGN